MRVKHLGQEFMPIKRLFRSVLIRNEKSACLQMSLGNVVGFVTRLLDDHWHSGSELPAPFSGNYGTPFVREADYSAMCSAFHSR